MKGIANPVEVKYAVIVALAGSNKFGLRVEVRWEEGLNTEVLTLDPGMTARYTPAPGDYVVMQEDGYTYVNPKEVFERKYHRADGSAWE